MPRTWILFLACACVLGTAGWWAWAKDAGGDTASAAPAPPAAVAAAPPAAPRLLASVYREPASPSRTFDPRREFESTPDLFTYAQRLTMMAQTGDADALWLLSRVHDYCAGFAANPVAYGNDTRAIAALDVGTAANMAAARERVSQRCARFMPADGLSSQSVHEARQRAARSGSLAAEAALMAEGEPLSEDAGYRHGLVERVVASGDPQAFLALSNAMGLAASGAEAELGSVSGTWLSELAWQIAACRLGLDCRPQGNLMTAYCAHGGICSRDPSQDFPSFVLDAGVPRQGADTLNDMVDNLLSHRRVIE